MCNCNVIIYFLLKRLVDIFWKTARIRDYKNNVQALHHEENVKEKFCKDDDSSSKQDQ